MKRNSNIPPLVALVALIQRIQAGEKLYRVSRFYSTCDCDVHSIEWGGKSSVKITNEEQLAVTYGGQNKLLDIGPDEKVRKITSRNLIFPTKKGLALLPPSPIHSKTGNFVRVVQIGGIHAVKVGTFFLDITATDKKRCEKIALDLRNQIASESQYSGWIFTDANRLVECPKCHSKPGENCKTPKGRKANTPHIERVQMLHKLHPGSMIKATRHGATGLPTYPFGPDSLKNGLFD